MKINILNFMQYKKTLLILLGLCFACSMYAESPKREFRATWLAAVGVDWPDNKVSSGTATQINAQKNELIAYLDQLVASNQNAVCYHVRPMADAFYRSNISLVPWSHYLTGTRGKSPGYDPLAFAIEEAHKRGLEIHAWLNPFRHLTSGLSSVSGVSSDPIKTQKPGWLLTYNGSYKGTILDPGNPEVRAHIVAVVEDIITNYDVDGIIIDDYFYPYGGTTTEDATSKSKYKPAGQSDDDWRRDNIDTTIKGIYDMIQSKKPWVRFGASPFGIYSPYDAPHTKYGVTKPSGITGMDAYGEIYCNTLAWMDGGYVDYVSPQLYWAINQSGQQYTTLSKWWSDMAKHFSDKQSGGKKIHFFSSQDVATHGTTEIGNQINYNRQYNQQDAPGSIFFSYDDLKEKGFPTYLKNNKFTQLALPPAMDWKSTTALAAPSNVTLSGSTLSWSHSSATRFTVYAYTKGSDNATAIASSSNLVGVVYGKSLNVSGVSGYANKTFAVCAYDRYGNEYNAGYYNLQVTEPTLTANPASFTLTGKHSQTAPYIDIYVEGLSLTSNISVNSSTGYVTLTKLSDWNDLTGGTLRATLSTASVLNNTGYIAVVSGTKRIEIPFTIAVEALVPTIAVSTSSVSFTGIQNSASKPHKDITITASDLSSDIVITSTGLVSCTPLSDWNVRTGGTLRLTLNTSQTLGDHTGKLTLTSGTVSQTISINATISDGPQAGTVSISTQWSKANPSYIPSSGNNNRSLAYYDNKLYIPAYDTKEFHIINAADGSLLDTKDLGVTSYHAFNLRITDDGQLLSGNGISGAISVYAVDKENGGSVEYPTGITIDRADYFSTYGDWKESGYVVSCSNTGNVAYIPFKQGALQTSSAKTLSIGITNEGNSTKTLACDETSFYAQNSSSIPQKYSIATGKVLESFGSETPATGIGTSGMAVFMVAHHKYMITPANSTGAFDIFEITEGLGSATRVIEVTSSLGTNANASATVDFATYVNGNDAYIYVLAPNNGVAAYKFTFTPQSPELTVSNTSVNLSGKVNQSPAPYVDIMVTGQNLSSAISVSSIGSGFTVEKLSGWSDLSGGTLRLTLNTNLAADTYTGTITVKSGTHSQTINVAATVNPRVPTITLDASSISLSAKINSTAPYKDVIVTASELSANLTIETSSDLVSVTKNAGWNDLTGGSLRLTLNTTKAADTYTCTVSIKSGTLSKVIDVTGTITPLQPTITLEEALVSFSAKQNSTAPYKDITITASDLSENMIIETSSDLVSVTKNAGWNDLTGGSLRLTFNTTKTAGTHTATVTIMSGTVSKTISITGTINPLQPVITLGESSVSFVAKQNAAIAPYKDITVTASDLSANLTIGTSSNLIAISKNAGWNDLTGGSIRLTLNTAMELGDHTCTVTVKSGTTINTIVVNATINDLDPKLTSTTTAISLWGERGDTAPYQDVTITGADLSEDIIITSTVGSAVTITPQSGWDNRTGGTLRITLDTNNEIGSYTGSVRVASGNASAVIAVDVDIFAPEAKEGTVTFDSNAKWTQTPSTLSCLSTTNNNRSMAYYDGKLYISDKAAGAYHVLDAATGTFRETVLVGYTDFEQHNIRITKDGQMLFGNTGTSTLTTLSWRTWDIDTKVMTPQTDVTTGARSDYFYPYGKWNESGFFLALSNSGEMVKVPYQNGVAQTAQTLSTITLQQEPTSDTANDGDVPKSAKAIPASVSSFYATATYNIPVKYGINGTTVTQLDEFSGYEQPASIKASGLGLFSLHGHNYMITPVTEEGGFDIFDITDGLNMATRVISPVPAVGNTIENGAMTIEYCTHLDGNDVYIYEFVPNNSLRAFKFTFTPNELATAVSSSLSDMVTIAPTLEGVMIRFVGNKNVRIFTVNGILVTNTTVNDLYEQALSSGVYIICVDNNIYKFIK